MRILDLLTPARVVVDAAATSKKVAKAVKPKPKAAKSPAKKAPAKTAKKPAGKKPASKRKK